MLFRRLLPLLALACAPVLYAADFDSLLQAGLSYRQQGLYHLALDSLRQAQQLAQTPQQQTQAAGALGQAYYLMHRHTQAEPLLQQAFQQNQGVARAYYANLLGSLAADSRQPETARSYYAEAERLAGDDAKLALSVALNRARLLEAGSRLAALQQIWPQLGRIGDGQEGAHLYLNLGEQARSLGATALPLAYAAFEQARAQSETAASPRLRAEALNALAGLYEAQQRPTEALALTRSAIAALQNAEAHDLAIELEWRQGRLLKEQRQGIAARDAYQRAVQHIEAVRQDIPVEYQDGRSSFRATLEPVYLGLADLLLQQARQAGAEERQRLLRQARDTVELIKQTEMEDYLGERCLIQSVRRPASERIDAHTALLYPILLPDRLELLLGLADRIEQYTVPVQAAVLRNDAQLFTQRLRGKLFSQLGLAQRLHGWLLAPLRDTLERQRIDTLVVVPDGVLRALPFAALHDGRHYAIERYAIATSPGLTLFDSAAPSERQLKILLAGLSEPGPVTGKLPPLLLNSMAQAARQLDIKPGGSRALPPSTRALPPDTTRALAEAERLRGDAAFQGQLRKLLSLPGVEQEVAQLHQQGDTTVLLNQDFTLARFNALLAEASYPVVHIATHGVFEHNADSSFIMTYDDLLTLDQLEGLLKSEKFRQHPLELITLSACQTAEGDDRAPLGFSGVALRARARGALGTLWPISDQAAQRLMTAFYQNLARADMSKVEALRQAQLSLLQQEGLQHPFYWSPFILVGNWL
ncbi:MAG: CHAT domain-containing protein [Methylococcaceae bacterium]|nr:MAG: CHAT domain-containing protein [Methylococcaceae bacterium]